MSEQHSQEEQVPMYYMPPSPAPLPTSKRKHTRRKVLAGLAILAVSSGWWWFRTHYARYIYRGHSAWVNAIAWSPDGKRIASASDDKTVQVWNAFDGTHVYTYHGHSDRVTTVAWSPDGKRIASTSDDHTMQVWDALDGSPMYLRNIHSATDVSPRGLAVVAWSSDSKRILSTNDDGTIQVWNAADGKHILTYPVALATAAVAWSPDGKLIASTTTYRSPDWEETPNVPDNAQDTAQVWNIVDSIQVSTYTWDDDVTSADSIAWSPDGKRIAVGGYNIAIVLDAASGTLISTSRGNWDSVDAITWSPDGKLIASTSEPFRENNPTVQVWNAATGAPVYEYSGHVNYLDENWIKAVAWSPDGKYIASGGADKTVQVWNIKHL